MPLKFAPMSSLLFLLLPRGDLGRCPSPLALFPHKSLVPQIPMSQKSLRLCPQSLGQEQRMSMGTPNSEPLSVTLTLPSLVVVNYPKHLARNPLALWVVGAQPGPQPLRFLLENQS